MMYERISDYFEGAAAKYLRAVDVDSEVSNQHEIGGLPSVGFVEYLGRPGKGEGQELRYPALMVHMSDDDGTLFVYDEVTWYDCRRTNPDRSPEYRLYYKNNSVTNLINTGDLLLVAKRTNNTLLLVFTERDSQCEFELRTLFDLPSHTEEIEKAPVKSTNLYLPMRLLLEEIGVETAVDVPDESALLDQMLSRFKYGFPSTSELSAFARKRVHVDSKIEPDLALVNWMEEEEKLFRLYENHLVLDMIREEIIAKEPDVDRFVSYSLSVHNRRKSRVGHAFEHHLAEIFKENGLHFQKGSSANVTENCSKPDFLFPGFSEYADPKYPADKLRMLGAKTSCKDRWRQVLAEADRIREKHLITMQPGMSNMQLTEMLSKKLQLVVPAPLQTAFQEQQRGKLISLAEFIDEVISQGHHS